MMVALCYIECSVILEILKHEISKIRDQKDFKIKIKIIVHEVI